MTLQVNDIPDVPPSLNKVLRMHWTKRRALLNAWRWMVRAGMFGIIRGKPRKRKVTITLCHSRLYDKDNAYGACKVVFDALKAEGFLVDDSPDWLDAEVKQEKCKRAEQHTLIEVSE